MSFVHAHTVFDLSAHPRAHEAGHGDSAPLRRPRMLIRAARAGQGAWRRNRDLPRLLGTAAIPGPRTLMRLLRAEEAWLDTARRAGDGAYSVERHVTVLIALLAEMRSDAGQTAPQPVDGGTVVPFTGRGTVRPERP